MKKTILKCLGTKRTIGHWITCIFVKKTILMCLGTKRTIGHGITCIWVKKTMLKYLGTKRTIECLFSFKGIITVIKCAVVYH